MTPPSPQSVLSYFLTTIHRKTYNLHLNSGTYVLSAHKQNLKVLWNSIVDPVLPSKSTSLALKILWLKTVESSKG